MRFKRLQGFDPPLCLRTQHYRMIFRDLGESIQVTRVRNCQDAYKVSPARHARFVGRSEGGQHDCLGVRYQ